MVRGKAEEVTFCTNLRGVRFVRKRSMLLTSPLARGVSLSMSLLILQSTFTETKLTKLDLINGYENLN